MKWMFSVVVPVYNVEKYLDRCVESLVNQSYREIEIILVDDGSTDSSGEMCDDYCKKHKNIKAIHKKNGGLASARNEGMKYAEGEYIAFVDSDDWVEKNTYEILCEKVKNENPDIINFGYQKVLDNKVIQKEYAAFTEDKYDENKIRRIILPDSIARERAFCQVNLPVQLSACMCVYKRKFLINNNIMFESERIVLSEDWLFNIRCLCRAKKMVILHDILYNYDTRGDSLSMSYKSDAYERRKTLYGRYREELKNTGNLNEVIERRLKNFWLEAIYGCYIIELNEPVWNKKRLDVICKDKEFVNYLKSLSHKNCSLKGLIFKFIVQTKMNWIMRLAYMIKRKMRIK